MRACFFCARRKRAREREERWGIGRREGKMVTVTEFCGSQCEWRARKRGKGKG